MSSSLFFIFSIAIMGSSFFPSAFGSFDGNDVIGPCIDNACPLQYECKNDLCIFVNSGNDEITTIKISASESTLIQNDVPASTTPSASSPDNQIVGSTLSDIPAETFSFLPSQTLTDTPVVSSSQESSTSIYSTALFAKTESPTIPSDTPLSIPTTSPTTTTKSFFDFGSPCFFGPCPSGYDCKNFWCIRSSSTSVSPTTTLTTPNPLSITTEEPTEITGPCIGSSCPDDGSICKNGFCVKSASTTCKDKRFGCALISYLCNIFTDLMTEDCAYTCKKC